MVMVTTESIRSGEDDDMMGMSLGKLEYKFIMKGQRVCCWNLLKV